MNQQTLFDTPPRIPADITARKHGGNAASIAANPTTEAKRAMHRQILAFFEMRNGRSWMKDVARELGKTPNEISGRLSELKASGHLIDTGEREEGCAVLRRVRR